MIEDLKKLDDVWRDIEVDAEGNVFEDVPDGRYQARIDDVYVHRSKNSSRLQIAWNLVITSGQYANRHLYRYTGLETPDNLKFLKQDLFRCGLEVPKLSDLPRQLPKLRDYVIEVQVKTKGEYQNIYINKLVSKANQGSKNARNNGDFNFNDDEVPF